VVNSFKRYIATLWSDTAVRALLQERNIKLEFEGEFFLDESARVCALDYEPSDCKYGPSAVPYHEGTFCENFTVADQRLVGPLLLSGCMQSQSQDGRL